ncbi:MAG: NVEALA domain-containing protein [Bacteroides sp.]
MRKNIYKLFGMIVFSLVMGYTVYATQVNETFDISLNTIEALADNEVGCVNGPNCWGYCFVNGSRYSCEDYCIWNCVTAIN